MQTFDNRGKTLKNTYKHIQTYTNIYKYIAHMIGTHCTHCTVVHTQIHIDTRTQTKHTHAHTHMHTHNVIHIHTYTHTHMYTHTHIHTCK